MKDPYRLFVVLDGRTGEQEEGATHVAEYISLAAHESVLAEHAAEFSVLQDVLRAETAALRAAEKRIAELEAKYECHNCGSPGSASANDPITTTVRSVHDCTPESPAPSAVSTGRTGGSHACTQSGARDQKGLVAAKMREN